MNNKNTIYGGHPIRKIYLSQIGGFSACVGGMGVNCGKSKTEQTIRVENNQLVINKDVLNQSLSDSVTSATSVANSMVSNCTMSSTASNTINIDAQEIEGSVNIGVGGKVEQKIDKTINMQCLQESSIRAEMLEQMSNKLMEDFRSKMTNTAAAELENKATQVNKQGSISFASPQDVKSNQNIINKVEQRNETERNLSKVIARNFTSNLSNEDVKNCIQKVDQDNKLHIQSKRIKGDVNIQNFSQIITGEDILSCQQFGDMSAKVGKSLVQELGLKVLDEKESVSTSVTKSKTDQTKETTGVIGDIGTAASDVIQAPFKGVSNVMETGFKGVSGIMESLGKMLMPIIIIGAIVAVVGGGVFLYFYLNKNKDGSGGDEESQFLPGRQQYPPQQYPPQQYPPQYGN